MITAVGLVTKETSSLRFKTYRLELLLAAEETGKIKKRNGDRSSRYIKAYHTANTRRNES